MAAKSARCVEESDYNSFTYKEPKGNCLVFVYSTPEPMDIKEDRDFKKMNDPKERNRIVDVDYYHLRNFFMKNLAVTSDRMKLSINRTGQEVLDDLNSPKSKELYERCECFFIVFLTYSPTSKAEDVYHDDRILMFNELFPLAKVYESVSSIQELAMKPKVFLIQADDVGYMKKPVIHKGSAPSKIVPQKIPTDADRLIIVSTIPQKFGINANIHPKDDSTLCSSILIKVFVDVLQEEIKDKSKKRKDLLTLTTLMNGKVYGMTEEIEKMDEKRSRKSPVPLVISTLSKLLYVK